MIDGSPVYVSFELFTAEIINQYSIKYSLYQLNIAVGKNDIKEYNS